MWLDGCLEHLWSLAVGRRATSKSCSTRPKEDPDRRKLGWSLWEGLPGPHLLPNNDDTWKLHVLTSKYLAQPFLIPSNTDFKFPLDLSLMDILRSFL